MSPTRMTRNAPMPSRNGAKISCTMYRSAMPVRMRRLRVARMPGEAGLMFCGSYLPPVGGVCMQVPSLIPWRVRQASLLRVSNAGIPKGCLGGMEARFAGGVCLLLMAIGTSACTGVISPPPVPKIYVVDESNNRIVRMDDMTGAGWTAFGVFGSGPNQFRLPIGIYVSAAGQIFVTDAFNHRIVRMDNMTGAGWITLGGPAAGSGMSQFSSPTGIFVSAGQIYVADTTNNRIVRMDAMAGAGWTELGGPAVGR